MIFAACTRACSAAFNSTTPPSPSPCSCSGCNARGPEPRWLRSKPPCPGLRETRWPGRLEVIRQQPLTVVDVGHTPDGIRQSLASLQAIHGAEGWILVVGVSRDKNTSKSSAHWRRPSTPSSAPRRITRARSRRHRRLGTQGPSKGRGSIAATIEEAVDVSRSLAAAQNRKIYVAGGLFLAIEYATMANGGGAEELDFF